MEPQRVSVTSETRDPSNPKGGAAREAKVSDLRVVGLSHRSATLSVREKFAVGRDVQAATLQRVLLDSGAREAVLVQTCNRVELYADAPAPSLQRFFAESLGQDGPELERSLYRYEGSEAIGHLFRVASSLDSLVLGEDQILNQVKTAYENAQKAGTVGGLLHSAFQAAIKTGKRVRRDTKIGERMLSVSSIAVDFVQKVFSDLKSRSVLLVGAGEAARLTLVHLRARGVGAVRIANRSVENAQKLAEELGAEAVPMDDIAAELLRADIVLTSVGAPQPLVNAAMVSKALKARHGRTLFLLDIAVPRDIEPAVEKLDGVYLYNLDDLQNIVRENYGKRTEDLDAAMRVVGEEVERFVGHERHRRLGPLVGQVVERSEAAAAEEVERSFQKVAITPELRSEVERLAQRLVRKLLYAPLTAIREEARTTDDEGPQRLLERLLENLPPRKNPGESS